MSSGDDIVRRYAALAVPRYTSYPTAAEFSAAVTPDHHARWLGRVGAGQRVSVYLHVPYCHELCFYCGCHTKLTRREDVIDAYRQALETEIETVAGHLGGRPSVVRLHWGGGTPSILGASGMKSVLDVLHSHFTFEKAGEHAIELDPRYVTKRWLPTFVRWASTGPASVSRTPPRRCRPRSGASSRSKPCSPPSPICGPLESTD